MKKLFFIYAVLFAVTVNAQETATPYSKEANAENDKTKEASSGESKEMKARLKKVKEQNLSASFSEAGLSEEQTKLAKVALDDAKEKSNKLKEDSSLSEEDKKTKKEALNQEKNARLKEIMKEKYKGWSEIRKTQKAREEEMGGKTAQ